MGNYNFNTDINLGESGEKFVIYYLTNHGATYISDNKDNRYDLEFEFKGIRKTYEVKTDFYCKPMFDSGNLFIEFECRGKPSGISVSQADWFVNYYPFLKQLWFIKTSDLKEIIQSNKFYVCTEGGDAGSNTHGYLVPRNTYRDKFIVKHV